MKYNDILYPNFNNREIIFNFVYSANMCHYVYQGLYQKKDNTGSLPSFGGDK